MITCTPYLNLSLYRRQVQYVVPVRTLSFISQKRDWINRQFPFIGISFVLHGNGRYLTQGREWRIKAPMILLQWPGQWYQYGPDHTWDEFHVTYDASHQPTFRTAGWQYYTEPVIPISRHDEYLPRIDEIMRQSQHIGDFGAIDRLDALCALLLTEMLTVARQAPADGLEQRLQTIRAWIDAHLTERISFETLAAQHGMAARTLRRHWRQRFGGTIQNYILTQRIHTASTLLVTTDLRLSDIASFAGFYDQCDFSRHFHATVGLTPSEYRKQNLSTASWPPSAADAQRQETAPGRG
jgi:AraC-like DNA-binding protein